MPDPIEMPMQPIQERPAAARLHEPAPGDGIEGRAGRAAGPRRGSNPSPSYTPVLGAYLVIASILAAVTRRVRGPNLPRPKSSDVVLLGVATFKLSRLLTKEKVTQPLREPFVDRTEPGEGSEVNSKPAGTGVRRSLGELLTCPFCLSMWIATGLTAGFSMAPRAVRLVASGLAAAAVSDVSQYAYSGVRRATS